VFSTASTPRPRSRYRSTVDLRGQAFMPSGAHALARVGLRDVGHELIVS
jgi:hypothetical protein